MSHYNNCAESVAEFAHVLSSRVRKGEINASAFEGLIDSFIESSAAIYPEWRSEMKIIAMRRL
jgi:hypothetical protein